MAELYSQPKSSLFADQKSGGVAYTGDAEVDSYLNELPEEERKKELDRYNSPLTGEEVAQALMRSTTYTPTVKEYKAYKEYQATKSTDIFDGISMAAGAVVEDLARGLQGAGQDPNKVPASVVEAFAQGTRNLYGMIAQSQDPDSIIFKWKDAISNTYSDEGYRQFLEARQFNRHSVDLMEGKTTLLVDKDLVNHDVVQAASYIADPTLFIPFGGVAGKAASLIGMGERLAAVTARASIIKNMVYAGALKYGAGVPLEFIGGATRRVIDKGIAAGSSVFETATGIAAKDAANYVRTAGFGTSVSGIAGYPVPYASAISDAYLKASVASGLGESLTAVADQMLKNQGRKGYMSFAEAAIRQSDDMLAKGGQGLSPHARKLLKVLDKADPMFAYAMEGLEGATAGAAIGGGLGYLTGGEEGLAGGIGSGAVLGGVGGMAGRVVSDVAGASLKAERKVQADIALELMKDADPAKFAELSRMRAVAEANGDNIDGYIAGLDIVSPKSRWSSGDATKHEAYLEGRGQDPKTFDGYERNPDGSYKLDKDGKKIQLLDEEGFTVPTMEQFNAGAGWTMTRNADGAVKVHINTTNYNPNTVPHELFHAIFREEAMKPEFKNRMTRALLGTYDENGKMVAPPTVDRKETRAFFESYIRAENKGNDSVIADRLSLLDKALTEYYKDGTMSVMSEDGKNPYLSKLTEEFGAYYFTQFIKGKRPDFLFRGGQYSGMRNLIETVKTGWLDYMERKITSVNPTFDFNRPDQTINPAFKDASGKRIRVSALDHLMTDIVKATAQTNRNGGFDFRTLSPEGQEAYVKANGLSRTFRKRANGKYERMSKPEQAAYDKARGVEIFKAIGGLSPDLLKATDANGVVTHELIPVRDAKGNIVHYEGTLPPAVLDHLQRTGYLDAPEKLRIQQLQDIVAGRIKSNIVEFIYHGREEGVAMGADVRVSGDAVATKARVALVLAMNNKIKANGEHSFTALTLDWRNVKMRGEKLWADPAVRKMWNDDQTAFQGDLFRYLENASQPDGKRLPSAQLWQTDGEAKRNIMHQFAGIQRTGVVDGKTGTYFNAPNKEIVNDITASLTSFRTDGMGNITLTGDTVKFNPEGVKPIAMNFMPSEMSNERTPTGNIRKTKDGWKFIEAADGVKVYRADGTEVGKWKTLDEATAGAEKAYQKENPTGKPIPSVDNIRQEPLDAPETQEQYIKRKVDSFYERPENALDLFKDGDFISWAVDKDSMSSTGEYQIQALEKIVKSIIEDANKPNQGDRFATDFIDYPAPVEYGNSSNKTIGDVFKEFYKDQYFKEQEAKNPTFVSGLSVALDKILPANVAKDGTISASRLLNQIKNASGGDIGKILTESNAIGFTDWLKSKGQNRVNVSEIKDFIDKNGIKVSIDPRTDIRGNEWQGGGFDTSTYVAEGKKDGYYTFVARINPEHAHGVEGHYGKDSIVHIRATIRTDAQGRKVLFIEEIQSINTAADGVTGQKRVELQNSLNALKPLHKSLTDLYNKQSKKIKDAINLTTTNPDYSESAGYLLYKYGAIAENIPYEIKKLIPSEEKELFNYYKQAEEILKENENNKYNFLTPNSLMMPDMIGVLTREISETESKLAKKKSDKPLQDFNETVKIANRTIMRKAVELGADRVVLVRPEDMHPDVSVNAEGERFVDALYGKEIPAMMNAELKKYGQQLRPANNFDLKGKWSNEHYKGSRLRLESKTKLILSESLGYDITPEMKQKAGKSQTFMMPSEGRTPIPFKDWEAKTAQEVGAAWSVPFYQKLKGAILTFNQEFGNISERVINVSIDKNNQPKIGTIKEEKYQSILKKFPEGKPRDNAIREATEEFKSQEYKKGEYRHPFYYHKNNIESIKFDASSTKTVKQISFNPQAISTAVSSIADELGSIEFDKVSTSALFGRKSRTGEVKGIIQNLQDAVQELQRASTPEEKANAQETINSHIEDLRTLKDELQDKHDNTPESFQETEAYTKREDALEALDDAITHIENTAEEGGSTDTKNMMPSDGEQGGRTYSDAEFKGSFIGAVAQKNPELIKGLSIKVLGTNKSFEFYLYDNKFSETSPIGEISTINTSLNNKENIITKAFIKPEYRGKGLGKLLYSELGERLRSSGIENLTGTIVDLKDRPFSLRASVFGEGSTILDKTEKYKVNTKLDPNARYMPSEYRSGDNYWKAKENKFEGVDENGQTYRLSYAVVNGKTEYNPSDVSWFDIGHSNKKGSGMWGMTDKKEEIMTFVPKNLESVNHGDWSLSMKAKNLPSKFATSGDFMRTLGRYEKPVYDKNNILIKKGKISMAYGVKSLSEAKEIKAKVASELGYEPDEFDAYIFGESKKTIGKDLGMSPKDQLPIKFMPAEQAEAWRKFESERVSDGNSIYRNAMNFVIIQANNKFKVYNPQKALLGIYTDLEEAKKRVRREEPKPR